MPRPTVHLWRTNNYADMKPDFFSGSRHAVQTAQRALLAELDALSATLPRPGFRGEL